MVEQYSIELIASVRLERDQLSTSLSNANRWLSELEEKIPFVMAAKKCAGGQQQLASSK